MLCTTVIRTQTYTSLSVVLAGELGAVCFALGFESFCFRFLHYGRFVYVRAFVRFLFIYTWFLRVWLVTVSDWLERLVSETTCNVSMSLTKKLILCVHALVDFYSVFKTLLTKNSVLLRHSYSLIFCCALFDGWYNMNLEKIGICFYEPPCGFVNFTMYWLYGNGSFILYIIFLAVLRGGFKEWPLRQWLTRPSRNEKRRPFGWTHF